MQIAQEPAGVDVAHDHLDRLLALIAKTLDRLGVEMLVERLPHLHVARRIGMRRHRSIALLEPLLVRQRDRGRRQVAALAGAEQIGVLQHLDAIIISRDRPKAPIMVTLGPMHWVFPAENLERFMEPVVREIGRCGQAVVDFIKIAWPHFQFFHVKSPPTGCLRSPVSRNTRIAVPDGHQPSFE